MPVKCRVAEYNTMPSKMPIAELYAKFFEIKVLLLVQLNKRQQSVPWMLLLPLSPPPPL